MKTSSVARCFPAGLIIELAGALDTDAKAESAVPSYTHWNPAIRWLMFRRLEVIREMVLSSLSRHAGRNDTAALDFGCGIGMLIPSLAPGLKTLYACDEQLSPAQATARRFGASNVVYVHPDELASQIEDSSLDAVIAADVLEHVDDLETVVQVFRRKLRDKGLLIVSGPTESSAYRCGRWIAGFSGAYHVRSAFDVEDSIGKARFSLQGLRRLPFVVPPVLFRITAWSAD
jgi:2-polyprenyl-3-methyl-5-hydroxy-6-metoxy-1,4-benzoquinol methylase